MNPIKSISLIKVLSATPMILVLLFSCFGQTDQEEPSNSIDTNYSWVEEIVQTTIREHKIPAISIGIIEDGKLSFAKGFGTRELSRTAKVDENTIYQIGSDTKKMTAIIANNLAKEGILDMKASVTQYLADVLSKATQEKIKAVTLAHLLSHQAGIPYRAPSNKRIDGEAMLEAYTEKDLVHDLNTMVLEFAPGSKFSYSNFDYAIAGYVCEKASGLSYARLIDQYVSRAFNMQSTSVELNNQQREALAIPYRKDNRILRTSPWKMGKMTPAGGVYSSVADISKLMLAQMEAYNNYSEQGTLHSPLILTDEDTKAGEGHYGFGLGKSVDEDGIRYGHGGDLDGYASSYVFSPKLKKGIIILTSSGGKWIGNLERTIRKELFK